MGLPLGFLLGLALGLALGDVDGDALGATLGLSLNPLLAIFNVLTTALISIDDAPIRLKALRRSAFGDHL